MISEFIRQIKNGRHRGAGLLQLRHYTRWKHSLAHGASSVKDRLPWLTYDAIGMLKAHLNKSATVFEFGGGGSTLFFLDHAHIVHTVEHNKEWFEILEKAISAEEKKRWIPVLAQAEQGKLAAHPDPARPADYSSDDAMYRDHHFRKYAATIAFYDDDFFDVVLVDGRARPSCVIESLGKVKPGGLLVVDNTDRAYYLQQTQEHILKNYTPLLHRCGASPYNKDFTQTSIWKKNS